MKLWLDLVQAAALAGYSERQFRRVYLEEESIGGVGGARLPVHFFPGGRGSEKCFILRADFDRIVLGAQPQPAEKQSPEVQSDAPQPVADVTLQEAPPSAPQPLRYANLASSKKKMRDPRFHQEVCRLFLRGDVTARALSSQLGVSVNAVLKILRSADPPITIPKPGTVRGTRSYPIEVEREVLALYAAGKSRAEVAQIASLGQGTVSRILRLAGAKARPAKSRYTGKCASCGRPTADGASRFFKLRCPPCRTQHAHDRRTGKLLVESRSAPRYDNRSTVGVWASRQSGYGGPRVLQMKHKRIRYHGDGE